MDFTAVSGLFTNVLSVVEHVRRVGNLAFCWVSVTRHTLFQIFPLINIMQRANEYMARLLLFRRLLMYVCVVKKMTSRNINVVEITSRICIPLY